MVIKTSNGTEYEFDNLQVQDNPPRMSLHIIGATIEEVANCVFGDGGLPFEGYEEYKHVQTISDIVENTYLVVKP